MVKLNSKFIRENWFSDRVDMLDVVWFSKHKQYRGSAKPRFMVCNKFYTTIVDLSRSAEDILSSFASSTRYEVRRASKEGIRFRSFDDRRRFVEYYNEFASSKGLKRINGVSKYGANLILTEAVHGDSTLCMHAYVVDKELRRVRLLYSASHFRTVDDGTTKNLIGMGNRFLHYEDMKYFAESGFSEYDFGGYALNTEDPVLASINKFKDGFNGDVQESLDCKSLPFYVLEAVYRWVR